MKRFLNFLHSSKFLVVFTLLVSVALFVVGMILFMNIFIAISLGLSFLVVVYITFDSHGRYHSYSVLFVSVVFPLLGLTLYTILKTNKGSGRRHKLWSNINFKSSTVLQPNQQVIDELQKKNEYQSKISKYVLSSTNMPVFQNTSTKFFGDSEAYFNSVIEELKKAERYIFIESYIIEQGALWESVFDILKIKARQGVEIKVLYDDEGCINRFDDVNTFEKLSNYRIDARAFNRIKIWPNSIMNYRNHKKYVIIDGKVGFTGGLNLGDIYFNQKQMYGAWKDSGIMLSGEAVWGLTVMFLNDWQFATHADVNLDSYKTSIIVKRKQSEWVQPFSISPFDSDKLARNIYLSMMQNARKSIYITAPTFIVDDETTLTLKMAAKSGIDVKIIFPGIPTNKTSYYIAREGFADLIRAGVKIYEYTPGFIHEKCLVIDNESAVVGNINWEFRDSHSRFANGVLVHGGDTVNDARFDFERTLNSCRMLTIKDMRTRKWTEKVISKILKFISPVW